MSSIQAHDIVICLFYFHKYYTRIIQNQNKGAQSSKSITISALIAEVCNNKHHLICLLQLDLA